MCKRLRAARRLQKIADEFLLRQTSGDRLLVAAELAGKVAWSSHGGCFAIPVAEQALQERPDLVGHPLSALDTRMVRDRTLHVLTEAYPVGGHTRLVKRWIELMEGDAHAVVLVRQEKAFDPSWVRPPGGDVPIIDLHLAGIGRGTDKVAHLMALFSAARRVVLHIHPDDACTVAAAYRSPGVDLQFLNHCDHLAWLGAGLPATMINIRERATRLSVGRRGIDGGNCDVVPIPVTPPRAHDRKQARKQLGIADSDLLVLTVATAYKFLPIEGRSLATLLDRMMLRPELKLVVIGPTADHPVFSPLAERHPGRVQVLGVVPETSLYRVAADLYLDSYPLASLTSMLESAVLGTPVVAFQAQLDDFELLYSECPGLPWDRYAAGEPGSFQTLMDELISSPALRQHHSEIIREGMACHLPDAWRQAMTVHLERRMPLRPWNPKSIPTLDSPIDTCLAALGRDPNKQGKLLRRAGVDMQGRLAYHWEQLLKRMGRN